MPVYRHNGDVYDIPQDKAREFESQFPEATVEVYSGNDVYDIPVGVQDEFFSRYSDASYSAPSAPSAEEVAEEIQPIRGFGGGIKQGTEQLIAGGKYGVAEYAEKGSDYDRAYNRMGELIDEGADFTNFDVDKQVNEQKMREYNQQLDVWNQEIARRKQERSGMGVFEAMKHRLDDPSRPRDPFDRSALATAEKYTQEGMDKELDTRRTYTLIKEALEDAGGDVEKARQILDTKSKEGTWADRWQEQAQETFANAKPTEGFGAWVGNMVPQMVGNVAAIAASTNPYTRILARPLGALNMAALTTSSAGSAMADARRYGEEKGVDIDDATARRAGLIAGTIEQATEAIPFDRYLNVTTAFAKKKLGKALGESISESPAAKNELSKLIERASRELGGELINGHTIKEWVIDAGLEGVSEFLAEGGGALVPMIYQNEEDYPTLKEILANGWEGAKAGMFMGGFLGGANRTVLHYGNKARRKEAGVVTLADTKDGVVEVLGTKDGKYVIMRGDGQRDEVDKGELMDMTTIPYNEFYGEVLEAENMQANEEGRKAQPEQFYDIDQTLRSAEQVINDMPNAEMLWDAVRAIEDAPKSEHEGILSGLADNERQLVIDYLNSKSREQGVVEGRAEQIDGLVEEYAATKVEPFAVTDANGKRMVTSAIYKGEEVHITSMAGKTATILLPDGRKVMDSVDALENVQTHDADELIEKFRQQTTEVVNQETEKNLNYPSEVFEPAVNVEVQTADGKTWLVTAVNGDDVQVSEMVLDRKSNTWNPNGAPKNMTRTEFMDWQKAELDRKKANTYEQGDELTFYVNGEHIDAEITGIDPEGNYMVQISHLADGLDKSVSDVYTAEELRKLTTPSSKVSEKTTENKSTPSEEINQSASEEVTNSQIEDNVTEPTAEVAESVNTALSRVPKDAKGNPLYEQTDADTAWDAIMEQTEGDADMAQRIAEEMVADKKAALDKMQKGKPKKGATVAEKIANEKAHIAAIAQAEQEVAAWEKIAQTEARRREAAMSEADRYAAEMEQKNISEGLSALGEPQSLQEYVLAQLAGGAYKLRWNDKENGTKGFGSHTGLSNDEMKARLSMIDNKNGLTPEEVAHVIVENMDASFGDVDVMDVTDMVIDAVSTYGSRRAMLSGLVESRAELIRQQEVAEQEAKDAWYMEQYHATEEELAAYNEYLAEFAEEIYGEDSDYEQRIATFAEIQLEYDNQGTDAGLRSSADQGEGLASDREGGRSVGETEQLNQREVLGDAAGVAASEDQGIGSSVSAQSDDRAARIAGYRNLSEAIAAEGAGNLTDEEIDDIIGREHEDDERLEREGSVYTEERLDNGDVRITGTRSNGEVASVSIERNGKVIQVDTYEDGALFERTDYDANGNATKVTRYKDGEVVSEQEYKDGKRKVTANAFEMAEEAQRNRKSKKDKDDTTRRGIQESPAEADRVSGEIFGGESLGEGESVSSRGDGGILEEGAGKKKRTSKARRQSDNRQEARDGKAERLSRGISAVQQQAIDEYTRTNPWDANLTDDERGVLNMYRMATINELDELAHKLADKINIGKATPRDRMRYDVLAAYAKSGELKAVADAMGVEYGKPVSLDTIKSLFETFNSDADLAKLFDRVFPLVKKINPTIIYRRFTEADIEEGEDVLPDDILGQYSLQENLIEYNRNQIDSNHCTEQDKASTIVHEMIHAVARYAIRVQEAHNNGVELDIQLPKRLLDAAQSLIEVYDTIKDNEIFNDDRYESGKMYGVSSVHEMLSELADPEFREKLKQVSIENLPSDKRGLVRDALRAIKDFIHRMFGWDSSSAYARTKRALDKLIDNYDSAGYNKARELTDDDFAQQIRPSSEENLRFRDKEEQKELIAVHNISEDNLKKVLEAGSLIMPSIAITKADMGHDSFGEISLLFDKSTINPFDRRNKVYGGDAWTPRFPRIGVKLNEKVVSRINKKAYELIDDRRLREIFSLSSEVYPDNIEKVISDYGVEGYYNKEWMKLAYLLDNGKKVKIPTKAKGYGIASEDIVRLAKEKGLSVKEIYEDYNFYKNNPDFVAQVKEARDEARLSSIPEEQRDEMRERMQSRPLREAAFDSYIRGALEMENDLAHGGLKEIVDRQALRDLIEKKVKTDNAEYNKWVDNLFEGIVEKRGIRNNRDWYTPSGDLRPWGQLYDPATPANILKHMLAENEQGGSGGLFDSNIMGASAETYESIEEIREKGQQRLKKLPYEEYDEWSNSVAERMAKICDDFLSPSQKNSIGGAIDAKIEITNAVAKDKTAKGIYKHMKREYPNFTMEHAKQVEEIVKEIQESATGYFEAKPQRLVSVNEVMAAVVPSNASKEIVDALKSNGIEVITYKKGDEEARKRVVKRVSSSMDIKFREGMGAISDREVSYENDPIAKWQGKPRYYGKRASAFAERERARMQKGVEEAAKILGLDVEIITDASALKGRKAKAKGWYDINSKKVVVVVPNHVSKGDAVRTVLHEGVAHHGLRELFGDGFDAMLDNVYNNVAPELKARIDAIAERTGVSTSVATEEYLASLAEETNFEEAKQTGWWAKIKGYFMKMLRKLSMPGITLREEITDNELRYLLWRSYQNLVDPNSYLKPLGYLDDVAKQKELKVGNYAENTMATPRAAEMSEAEEWSAITMQRIEELEAQMAQLDSEIAEMEADRDADDASRYDIWEQQIDPLREQLEDVYAEIEGLYSLDAEDEDIEEYEAEREAEKQRQLYQKRIDNAYLKAVREGNWEEATDLFRQYVLSKAEDEGIVPMDYGVGYRGGAHSSIAKKVKEENPDAIAEAAYQMSIRIPKGSILVPMPSRTGNATYTVKLAEAIAKATDSEVRDVLKGKARMSVYEAKQKGIKMTPKDLGMYTTEELPKGKNIVIIDNVIDKGTTALAAVSAVKGASVVAYAYTLGDKQRAVTLKLAEPVTYDDNKRIIPLSQRFDKETDDIRYRLVDDQAEIIAEVEREAGALGVPVRIVRSVDELPDEDTRKRAVDGQLKGYFDPRTGEVALYEPNTDNANDAKRTILHETVGHKGLRQLIGEQRYDKAMVQLMYMLPSEVRDAVLRRAERHGWNAAIAMDEYLAEQAERDVQPTWWGRVNAKIRALLRNMGFNVRLTDADVTYLLWRSRKKLMGDTAFDMATDAILKQAARKSVNYDAESDNAIRHRGVEQGKKISEAVSDYYEKYTATTNADKFWGGVRYMATHLGDGGTRALLNDLSESQFEDIRSVRVLEEAIESAEGKPLRENEMVHKSLNAKTSRDARDMDKSQTRYFQPMAKLLGKILGKKIDGRKIEIDDVERYLICKHSPENNEFLMKRAHAENRRKKIHERAKELMKGTMTEEEAIAQATSEYTLHQSDFRDDYSGLTELFPDEMVREAKITERAEELTSNGVDEVTARQMASREFESYEPTLEDREKMAADEVARFEAAVDGLHEELWGIINGINRDTIERLFRSGLISRSLYNDLKKRHKFYVPLSGWKNDAAADIYNYAMYGFDGTPIQTVIKKAFGTKYQARNILGSMFAMNMAAITEGNQNLVKQKLYNLALNHDTGVLQIVDLWEVKDGEGDAAEWKPAPKPELRPTMSDAEMQKALTDYQNKLMEMEKDGKARKAVNSLADNFGKHTTDKEAKRHHVELLVNGRKVVIWVNGNPKLAQAINGDLKVKKESLFFDGAVDKANRFLAQVQTSLNPEFMISNFERDILSASRYNLIKYGPKYEASFMKHLAQLMPIVSETNADMRSDVWGGAGIFNLFALDRNTNNPNRKPDAQVLDMNNPLHREFVNFLNYGGKTGYVERKQAEDLQQRIKKLSKREQSIIRKIPAEAAGWAVDTIEHLNEGIENATRFAAYLTARERGKSVTEAVFEAKEVSVNFNMQGSGAWGNASFRKLYNYFNVGLQSLRREKNLGREFPKAYIANLAFMMALGAISTVLLTADWDGDDEDEYMGLSDFNRYNYINVKTENGFIHYSLPQDLRAFYAIGCISTEWAMGKIDSSRAMQAYATQANNYTPLSFVSTTIDREPDSNPVKNLAMSFVPSAAVPVAEIAVNEDFLGRRIHNQNQRNEYEPEWQRAGYRTPEWVINASKTLSEAGGGTEHKRGVWFTEINPSNAWHIMDSYGGGFLDFAQKTYNLVEREFAGKEHELRDYPMVSKFYVESGQDYSKQRVVNDRYRMYREDYETIDNELNGYLKDKSNALGKLSVRAKEERLPESVVNKERAEIEKTYEDNVKRVKESPNYWIYESFVPYEKGYNKLNSNLGKARKYGSEQTEKELSGEMYNVRKKLVDEIDAKRERPIDRVRQWLGN